MSILGRMIEVKTSEGKLLYFGSVQRLAIEFGLLDLEPSVDTLQRDGNRVNHPPYEDGLMEVPIHECYRKKQIEIVKPTCKDCVFSVPYVKGDLVVCKRMAPQIDFTLENSSGHWPSVHESMWCGEFKKKEGTDGK